MSISSTDKVSFQKSIFNLVEQATGTSNIFTIPYAFLKQFNGDHAKALFFSQLLYWSDKSKRQDGWFYKSYEEWEEELFLTPYQIRKYTKELKAEGLIDTKIKKANNKTTVHYFVRREALFTWVVKNFNISGSEIISQPLTETTTEITERNKGILTNSVMSFLDFSEMEEINNPDVIPAIEYYLDKYRENIGKEHTKLKVSQWQKVTTNILYFNGEHNDEYMELEQIEQVIDKHFLTQYDNCDYNILHFVSGDIIKNRFYEECY